MAGGYGPPLLDFSPLGRLGEVYESAYDRAVRRRQDAEAPALIDAYLNSLGEPALANAAPLAPLGRRVPSYTTAAGTPRRNVEGTVHVAEAEEDVQRLERATGMNTEPDRDRIIRTVYGEAGNQAPDGQAAVASVIMNRAQQSGMTPSDVVLAKGQFEPWSDPAARARMERLDPNSPDYRRIAAIVDPVMRREAADVTGGATHFYAPKAQSALGRSAPAWDDGTGVDIGDHRFFRLGYSPQGQVQAAQADLPAPGSRPVQFRIPGQPAGMPSAEAEAAPQRPNGAMVRALYANPNTRGLAQDILRSSMSPQQSAFDFQVVGDQLYRVNKRTGAIETVPGATKPNVDIKEVNGRLIAVNRGDLSARDITPEGAPGAGGMFRGNGLDAQALNYLVETGQLTRQQAAEIAAGKQVTGPNGENLFVTPSAIVRGHGAAREPAQTGALQAPDAPGGQPGPQRVGPGVMQLTPPKPEKATEGEKLTSIFADRAQKSNGLLADLDTAALNVPDVIGGRVPFGADAYLTSPRYKQYDQAKRDFVNAVLRKESGAVISAEEFANAERQYFPRPGDDPDTIEQKRRNRQTAVAGLVRASGSAMPKNEAGWSDMGNGIRIRRKQ